MKLSIKIRRINKNLPMPEIMKKGEWVDLRASDSVELEGPQAGVLKYRQVGEEKVGHRDVTFDFALIPLGVSMELPKGFEAHILPRSSTFHNFGIVMANSKGIVDWSYKGNNDEWRFPAVAFRDTKIEEGDRICQFRIQLSQKATFKQKLRWLLSDGIEFTEVNNLGNPDRKGLGSTGVK